MPRLLRTRAALEVLRGGHLRARLRATRDGQAAIRLAQLGAGLSTGLLDALAERPAGTAELAGRCGAADEQLLAAFLRALAAAGVVQQDHDRWALTADGRAVVDDDLVRAAVEAFSGFHTDLYRGMGPLLAGGPRRSDVATSGAVIARVSAAFEPFVLALLTRTAADVQPERVLDVGCGAGLQLAAVLETVPGAAGIGIETDAGAAALAEATLAGRGLARRSTVVRADVRQVLDDPTGPLAEPVDLVLLANVVYYVPRGERTPLLADLARCLAPGGRLVVVTTAAGPAAFSRHFDLLLRAQEGAMELPDTGELAGQMRAAGLTGVAVERLAPGAPLVALTGRRG